MILDQILELPRRAGRVSVRRLAPADRQEFIELVNKSSDLLHPWVVLPRDDQEFDDYLRRFDRVAAECILICIGGTGAIAGTISISDIRRGPYQRGTVGYNAFEPHARQGYILEGMRLVFQFAFEDLRLHRLEADIQPDNLASLHFAKKAGFQREGYSPGLIYLNDDWRDHERWAVTAHDLGQPRVKRV